MNDDLDEILEGVQNLPSVAELQKLIADAEMKLFTQQSGISDELVRTAWFLFTVATAKPSLELYSWPKQRAAYQLAAHIFDLALLSDKLSEDERFMMAFAAQVGYTRGELNPNAIAIYRRLQLNEELSFYTSGDEIALNIGVMFLAQDRKALFPLLQRLWAETKEITSGEQDILFNTRSGANYGIVAGVRHLIIFLTYGPGGHIDRLSAARDLFLRASKLSSRHASITARWVAVNLINVVDDLRGNNIWDTLPPNLPSTVARAMTNGDPSIFSLWPPQAKMLRVTPSPLLTATKHIVVSFPTSAGKTLMAQLFIVSHLEQQEGGVCLVVPTHSLAREVRSSLRERLRFIGLSANALSDVDEWSDEDDTGSKLVDVMTPEKLAYLLKNQPGRVLRRYSLFIFDEAHLIGDRSRGWTVESVITFLRALTQKTEHRIVLMSALIGNRVHMYRWLNGSDAEMPDAFHSDWRGPRRLYAIYNTEPRWADKTELTLRSGRKVEEFPLYAHIRLKTGIDGQTQSLGLKEPVGKLRLDAATRTREATGTPFYKQMLPFIKILGESGPILIIETTKVKASMLSVALAELLPPPDNSVDELANFIALRLGAEHPLATSVRKGVAFHHGALPTDIQSAIENAVKDGTIKYVVATTTLAEGVNLPVRTVFIAEQGMHNSDGEYERFISGPKLLNAIGRAGRAGKESDGWIILGVDKRFSADLFDELAPTMTEEYDVKSLLATDDALEALRWYEEARNTSEDAIFEQTAPRIIDEFVTFVWSLGTAFEDLNYKLNDDNLGAVLSFSLAWKQLSEDDQTRWRTLAQEAFEAYKNTPEKRLRWARAGISLSSAARLEEIKDELFTECVSRDLNERLGLQESLELLVADGRLDTILSLKEANIPKVRPNQSSPNILALDSKALLLDWVGGVDLKDLGERYMSEIRRLDFMFEQLSAYTAAVFEHYLPWIFGIVINWVNNDLESLGFERMFDEELPQYVHYGVNSSTALELLKSGMNSRRLANVVAAAYDFSGIEQHIIAWLQSLDVSQWQELFEVSLYEVRELLECTQEDGILKGILFEEGAIVELAIEGPGTSQSVVLKEVTTNGVTKVVIAKPDGTELGVIPPKHQVELRGLLRTGAPFLAQLEMGRLYIKRIEIE